MISEFNLEGKDWVMILAVILGPILAVQAQKIVEHYRDKKARRLNIFKTLMSTRSERLSREHVSALNMIDMEFYGFIFFGVRLQSKHEKSICNCWKKYNDSLNIISNQSDKNLVAVTRENLFVGLLYAMSQALGYDFDDVQLRRDCYRPKGFVDIEEAQLAALHGLAGIIKNGKSIPVTIITNTSDSDSQNTNPQLS